MAKYLIGNIKGPAGMSPTATVEQTQTGATITITDANGTTTANIRNGIDGTGEPVDLSDYATKLEVAALANNIALADYASKEYVDDAIEDISAPVQSVNGMVGNVVLTIPEELEAGENITIEDNTISASFLEEDPIFTSSPAATITQSDIDNWNAGSSSDFSGDYDDLTNKPDLSIYAETAHLATVAITGDYSNLVNKPTIPVLPTLATVATSGSYTDLSNKPTIPIYTAGNNITISNGEISATDTTYTAGTGIDITGNVISATGGGSGSYGDANVRSYLLMNFGLGQNEYDDQFTMYDGNVGANGAISFTYDSSDDAFLQKNLAVIWEGDEHTFELTGTRTWTYESSTITASEYDGQWGWTFTGTLPLSEGDWYEVNGYTTESEPSQLWPQYVNGNAIHSTYGTSGVDTDIYGYTVNQVLGASYQSEETQTEDWFNRGGICPIEITDATTFVIDYGSAVNMGWHQQGFDNAKLVVEFDYMTSPIKYEMELTDGFTIENGESYTFNNFTEVQNEWGSTLLTNLTITISCMADELVFGSMGGTWSLSTFPDWMNLNYMGVEATTPEQLVPVDSKYMPMDDIYDAMVDKGLGGGGSTYTAGANIDITNDEISLVDDVVIETEMSSSSIGVEIAAGGINVYNKDANEEWTTDAWMNTQEIGVEDVVNGTMITMTTTDGILYNDGTNTKALAMNSSGNLTWDGDEIALASDIPADELPTISSGDAGKVLTVNSGETGVEWTTPSGGGSSYTAGDGIEIDVNNVISNNRNPMFPLGYESDWKTATTKDKFISCLKNGEIVRVGSALNNLQITPSDFTSGRTQFIYVGGAYSSNKVQISTTNSITLSEYTFYCWVKGNTVDTIYKFQSPDTFWKTIPIDTSYTSSTYHPTLLSLFNDKQNKLPAMANNAGKVLAVNSDASGYEWITPSGGAAANAATALYLKDANDVVYEITVDTSGTLTATQVSNN